MAGDKKGKSKMVVQKKKKRTREDREREQAEAVVDAADRQGSLRIREPQAQGEPQQQLRRSGHTQTAQATPESRSRPRTRGGGTQRGAGHAQQQQHTGSDTQIGGQDSGEELPEVELFDLRGIPGPRVKRLRYVTPEQWFPEQRDVGVDRRFYTLLQESFYHTYCQLDIKISEHKMLHWAAMRVAAGGTPVLPLFERYDGLPTLLSERSRYIREWVRVFYATLFIEEDRQFIDFMFQ